MTEEALSLIDELLQSAIADEAPPPPAPEPPAPVETEHLDFYA